MRRSTSATRGKYLARFGLPGAIRGAPTKVRGNLAWDGGPEAFDYPTLSGKLPRRSRSWLTSSSSIPAPAKLLGVLSLQSLRRRLTFDYQDVFGEGFAFDEITGDVSDRERRDEERKRAASSAPRRA